MRLTVRLTPKASAEGIDGWSTDDKGRPVLKVRVRAPPIDGKANLALVALLAKTLDVPRSRVRLIAGESARFKLLEIEGLDEMPSDRWGKAE